MDVSDRIKQRMQALSLKAVNVVKLTGSSKGSVSQWTNGVSKPSGANLIALSKALQCSPDWLLTGKDKPQENGNAEILGNMQVWDSKTPLSDDEVSVPFLSDVTLSAGNGFACDIEQDTGFRLRFAKSTLRRNNVLSENAVCVAVTGNSMEPVLPDGSTVGIDCGNKTLTDGKIYAINHNGELFIKRLYKLPGGGMRIFSFNEQEYPQREYSKEQIQDQNINIIGRVFWYSVIL